MPISGAESIGQPGGTRSVDLDEVEETRALLKGLGVRSGMGTAVVAAEAIARGITVSASNRNKPLLSHGKNSYTFGAGITNFNSLLARRCVNNKEVANRLLRGRGLPAPESVCFRSDDITRAWAWAKPVRPVVLKPSNSTHGKSVYVDITKRRDFFRAFTLVAAEFNGVLIEPFHNGTEHRVIVVDRKVVAATRRVPAHVVGDGRSTVAELVAAKNLQRRTNPIHKQLELNDIALEQLRKQGLNEISVPHTRRQVFLRSTSNIHTGGDAIDATDDLSAEERSIAERATGAIPGLQLASVDLLLPRRRGKRGITILEVNAAPMVTVQHWPWSGRPRNVAGALIDAMFPDSRA